MLVSDHKISHQRAAHLRLTPSQFPCVYGVRGCLDSRALNYQSVANVDDGSCVFNVVGCTIPFALNYDSTATQPCDGEDPDFGCCRVAAPVVCSDTRAMNYGYVETCRLPVAGCMDPAALNYASQATVQSKCIYPRRGCRDTTAINFDAEATLGCDVVPSSGLTFSLLGNACPCAWAGCTDSNARNYDEQVRRIPHVCACLTCL